MVYEHFSELKKYLWYSYLHKLMTACGYICMLAYILQFTSDASIILAIACSTGTILYQVFMLCFIGQLQINGSECMSLSLYMTKWYEMPVIDQKRLMLILRISQLSVAINSFGIDAISNNTFVMVIRAALSYAAILYTFLN
ncbi:hypothetical protein DMENIID0001_014390 [Sergentomyia squamirostris]